MKMKKEDDGKPEEPAPAKTTGPDVYSIVKTKDSGATAE